MVPLEKNSKKGLVAAGPCGVEVSPSKLTLVRFRSNGDGLSMVLNRLELTEERIFVVLACPFVVTALFGSGDRSCKNFEVSISPKGT